jgi:succinylglutamic semialdehyde dehydrogenase
MTGQLYINGEWKTGRGEMFGSFNPANFERIWEGRGASSADIEDVMEAARVAGEGWALLSREARVKYLMCWRRRPVRCCGMRARRLRR